MGDFVLNRPVTYLQQTANNKWRCHFHRLMDNKERASTEEIFQHLEELMDSQAKATVLEFDCLIKSGCKEQALNVIRDYDQKLGGTGIFLVENEKLPGVYRPLSYVWFYLKSEQYKELTRPMIQAACNYLEELLKKIARLWPWEEIAPDRLSLGALVKRAKGRIPPRIYPDLVWLSSSIYNMAKHHGNLENEGEPDHYFTLAEAIAIYLIVRKLGLELEELVHDKSKLLQPL